ncbi:hypothetical protein HCA61_13825 [Rhodococcus sp. HNM0563]|uniref:hypothetical protein n=1 Tax=Rhodococcus sp. HNM0563 TaxID=2716339 RepID=UPI00146B74CF|nr:hypothetical protein [Rhodococcus sp. HNM0563]NLU63340.1 hypothetical protein [Rhodococcus sp. HNM0563]
MAPLIGAIATFVVAWVAREVCDIIAATVTALIITAHRPATGPRSISTTELPCPTPQQRLVRS